MNEQPKEKTFHIDIDPEAEGYKDGDAYVFGRRKDKKDKCLHNGCSECHGSGRKESGESCVHMISCPCSSCRPFSL